MTRWWFLAWLAACADPTPQANDSDVPDATEPAPGAPIAMRRLTAWELQRSTSDLLGIDLDDAVAFPEEALEGGYDHLVDTTLVSDTLVERLERYASEAADAWQAGLSGPTTLAVAPNAWDDARGCAVEDSWDGDGERWVLFHRYPIDHTVQVPEDGAWRLTIEALHRPGERDNGTTLELYVDGVLQAEHTFRRQLAPVTIEVTLDLLAGPHELTLSLPQALDDDGIAFYEVTPACVLAEGVVIDTLHLTGPRRRDGLVPACTDATCERAFLDQLASRAWRRPATAVEIDRLAALVASEREAGAPSDAALAAAVHAVLLSPRFLFLVEPAPTDQAAPLDGWALAARLALALWGSLPDDELRSCAASGTLTTLEGAPCALREQSTRMLADPRATAFTDRFVEGWLDLRRLSQLQPDAASFPALPAAMPDLIEETRAVFEEFLRRPELPAGALLQAPFTWLSPPLATLYGLEGPRSGWARVELADPDRQGLLGQASVLVATSPGGRTSPTLRGAWVLSRLLCESPGSPPPDVGTLNPGEDVVDAVARHVADPACAACHERIDPLGLPLERFDAAGQRRDEAPEPVALSPNAGFAGQLVDSPAALAAHVAADPRHARCLAQHVSTFLLGRAVGKDETARLDHWRNDAATHGDSWQALVLAVVSSPSFTHRQAPSP